MCQPEWIFSKLATSITISNKQEQILIHHLGNHRGEKQPNKQKIRLDLFDFLVCLCSLKEEN